MLTVKLKGGLGNQLFQLAAGETIARETGRQFYLAQSVSPWTHHTTQNYFTTIFRPWTHLVREGLSPMSVGEPSYARQDWTKILPSSADAIEVDGYFQNRCYISPTFTQDLIFRAEPSPIPSVFLHIRGGDYVGHWLHDVGLANQYYPWAIRQFPADTHFLIFTNDLPYATRMPFLESLSYSFAERDEVQALDQMRRCLGGICANSTFSWWGAYLAPNRKIVIPSKWFNSDSPELDVSGLFVPGWTIGPVSEVSQSPVWFPPDDAEQRHPRTFEVAQDDLPTN